ncbi:hypothetical protein OG946_24465 [Streptomyces sp. NBC_01808]|uniref:hypothetical protein n=1 Tax=Streptomyces sp. NBC_01808 TaxID=2975947 RepID=UPI002DDAFDA4|nr:hypothetical protein [Streptomyces sp. NBC_01808]WSA40240.1 hypothetical protein OG946_24465 [Streptomyces sp. NBC_01808]
MTSPSEEAQKAQRALLDKMYQRPGQAPAPRPLQQDQPVGQPPEHRLPYAEDARHLQRALLAGMPQRPGQAPAPRPLQQDQHQQVQQVWQTWLKWQEGGPVPGEAHQIQPGQQGAPSEQDDKRRQRDADRKHRQYWKNPNRGRQREQDRRDRLGQLPKEERERRRKHENGLRQALAEQEQQAASEVYAQYRRLVPGCPEVPSAGLTVAVHPASARRTVTRRTPAAILVQLYAARPMLREDPAAHVPSVLADPKLDLDHDRVQAVIDSETNETVRNKMRAWQATLRKELWKEVFRSGIPGPPPLSGHLDAGLNPAPETAPEMFGAPYAGDAPGQAFGTGQWPHVLPVMDPSGFSAYGHLPAAALQGTPSNWNDALSQAMGGLVVTAPVSPTDISAYGALPARHEQVAYAQGSTPWPPGWQFPSGAGSWNPEASPAPGPAEAPGFGQDSGYGGSGPQFPGGVGPSDSHAPHASVPLPAPSFGGLGGGYVESGPHFYGGAGSFSPQAPHAPEPAAAPRIGRGGAYGGPGQQSHGGFGGSRPPSRGPGAR